jgi:hypothetical protein
VMDRLARSVTRIVRQNWLVLFVAGALAVAFLALRTPAGAVGSAAEVDEILTNGQPTLLEFYSNT